MAHTESPTPKDPEEDEVSRGELIAYSLPDAGINISNNVMTGTLANPILVTTLGFAPSHVGLVMMVRSFWDAIADPILGYASDNFRSRYGRRKPLIFFGGILMAITLVLAWRFPTDKGEMAALVSFGIGLLIFSTAQSIVTVSYHALGMELSRSYHGRTRVQMAKSISSRLSSFIIPFIFPFCLLSIFGNALEGARWFTVILAVFLLIATTIAALKSRERTPAPSTRENFFKAIASTAKSKDFLRVAGIYAVLLFIIGAFGVFQYFLVIYYVFGGKVVEGASFNAMVDTWSNVLVIASLPVVNRLSRRFEKHNALRGAVMLMILGAFVQYFLFNPRYPALLFVGPLFQSLGISATFMILGALMADAVDADELNSGQRREGLFSATAGFMMKTMFAIAIGLSGFLIEGCGFIEKNGGAQAAGVFDNMRLVFVIKGFLLMLCLVFLHKYPLTQKRIAEIQAELKRRREVNQPLATEA